MGLVPVGIIPIHIITMGPTIHSVVMGTIDAPMVTDSMNLTDMEILTVTTVVTMEIIMELETVGIALLT